MMSLFRRKKKPKPSDRYLAQQLSLLLNIRERKKLLRDLGDEEAEIELILSEHFGRTTVQMEGRIFQIGPVRFRGNYIGSKSGSVEETKIDKILI